MSESAPRINPEDVFPRRNLPGAAEQWGRVVEDRTRELEKNAVAVNQALHGANRGAAAQLASISEQLNRLAESVRVSPWSGGLSGILEIETLLPAPPWAELGVLTAGISHTSGGFITSSGLVQVGLNIFAVLDNSDQGAESVASWLVTPSDPVVPAHSSPAAFNVSGGGAIRITIGSPTFGDFTEDFRLATFVSVHWSRQNPL